MLIHKEKSRFPFSATAHRDFEIFKKAVLEFCGLIISSSGTEEQFCIRNQEQWDFSTTALERMTQWSSFYFTNSTSYYPVPSTQIRLHDFPRMTQQSLLVMSSADQNLMRTWANTYAKCVRQRTV